VRRQDEIRILIAGQTAANRKFLMSELDRFAQAFDADELADLLRDHFAVGEVSLRRQALVTGTLFAPPYTSRRHGATEESVGVWTNFLDDASRAQALSGQSEIAVERVRRGARERLAPLVAQVGEHLERLPEDLQPSASIALALTPGAHQFVQAPGGKPPATFGRVWGWSASGGARADTARLLALLDHHGPTAPDLFHAALHLPSEAVGKLVREVIGRVDWTGIAHLATAAARAGGADAMTMLEALSYGATGWGAVYVLRALETLGRPAGLDLAKRMHASATHEFVRQQAIRTAGTISSEAAIQFLLAQLSAPEPGNVAQALESLVRVRCPKSDLAEPARALVKHADLRVRVNALLATVEPEEGRLPAEAIELLKNADAFVRVEGAFCLGYWQSRLALKILSELAVRDANPLVRTQAIKSVSRYDAALGIPVLTHLVETAPPGEALVAARVMARLRGQVTQGLADFFIRELVRHTDPARRALLIGALGGLSVSSRDPRIEGVFATALAVDDARIAAAALEGFTLMGGPVESDVSARLVQLAKAGGPVGAAAAVVAFLAGDFAVIDRLIEDLRSGDAARAGTATRAALELVQIAGWGVGPANARLARALGPVSRDLSAPAAPPAPPAHAPVAAGPVLAEGDFEVRVPPAKPGASDNTEQRTLQELFPEAPPKRQSRSMRPPAEAGQQLGKRTYLIAPAERERALEAESTSARAARAVRRTVAFLRQNPILIIPPVALGLVAGVIAFAASAEPPKVVTKTAIGLTVMSVQGRLRIQGDEAPLAPADVVRVGEVIWLDATAEARLVTATGDEIHISENAEVKLAASADLAGVKLVPTRGTITATLVSAVPLEVAAGGRRVGGRGVGFRCSVGPASWQVEALTAGVETMDASGTAVLERGAKKELK
jgi:hypothetical protein